MSETETHKYVRVYIGEDESPTGIARVPIAKPFWYDIDGEWVNYKDGRLRLTFISFSEYETDIAFETFPVLDIDLRERRVWLTRYEDKVHIAILILSFIGLNMAVVWPAVLWSSIPGALILLTCVTLIIARFEKWGWWKRIFWLKL